MMKTTCLINNYNYGDYVGEALRSALEQTTPFNEIIVVDDGSTDGSLDVIHQITSTLDNVQVIAKGNEGQLSCFNEGFKASKGDLIFFLDSDDQYTSNYLKTAVDFYAANPDCDCLCTAVKEFGTRTQVVNYVEDFCPQTGDVGFSLLKTLYGKKWVCSVTSSLSMRRSVLDKFLPLHLTQDWKVSADICLSYGSSLMGARIFCLPEPLVNYRVHANNNLTGRYRSKNHRFNETLRIEKLTQHILKDNYGQNDLGKIIWLEYRSLPFPDYLTTKFYLKLLRNSYMFPADKRKMRIKIYKQFLKNCLRKFKRA